MTGINEYVLEFKSTNPQYFWGAVAIISFSLSLVIAIILVKHYRKRKKFPTQKEIDSWFKNMEKSTQEKRSKAHKSINTKKKSNYVTSANTEKLISKNTSTQRTSDTKPISTKTSNEKKPEKIQPKKLEQLNEPEVFYQPTKKKKTSEVLPEAKKEENTETTDILTVNYILNIPESLDEYAILRIPKKGCVVRSYRIGKTKRRGYKENTFQASIERYFGKQYFISGDIRLNAGSEIRPFETDIAIIEKTNILNLRIDIEIDEPYAGITRQPTHCAGDDFMRDTYFVDRGWMVIRFSEHQVHTQEFECLKYIAHLIKTLDQNFVVPVDLNAPLNLKPEKTWDILQAESWEKSNYREQYLEHTFEQTPDDKETVERGLNSQEKQEEELVKSTKIGVFDDAKAIGYNQKNSHLRDRRIRFYPEPHVYTVDGVPFPSASTVISRFFPEFNPREAIAAMKNGSRWGAGHKYWGIPDEDLIRKWKEDGMKAANYGTYLHEQIEKYYLKKEFNRVPEFHLFEQFAEAHESLIPFRSEWRIFDEEYNVAGTVDFIGKNGSGYEMYDWKRSAKIIGFDGEPIIENRFNFGKGILNDIPDTSFNRYCLQQSLYRYILEKRYDLKISKMFLIVLHPDYSQYYKVEAPYKKDKVEQILQTL